jgi:6-phosphofructokinase 1
MITRQNGKIVAMPFRELMDAKTGRTRVRLVDVGSESYAVARQYMIRLGAADLADPLWAKALADAGHTTVADLQERFGAA